MRLIYLGHTFHRSSSTPQNYRKPYAVNWRYQVPGQVYGGKVPHNSTYSIPRVISWRWQILTS
jgi:hypothetical protein